MKAILIGIFAMCFFNAKSQDSLLNYLLADASSHSIVLRWEMKSGATCNGIEIYRSTDDSVFTLIHVIPGICGNASVPVAYQFEDVNPVHNQTNYYRIKPGNGTESSSVSVFFVELNTNGYFAYPNPAENHIKIYFSNKDFESLTVQLMNGTGQILKTEQVNSTLWELDLSELSAGIYFFSIDPENKAISGTIIVQ